MIIMIHIYLRIIAGAEADDAAKQLDEGNKGVIFKNSATFTDCTSKINNTQVDNAMMNDEVSMLWCQCIISSNIAIIIQKHLEVYHNIVKITIWYFNKFGIIQMQGENNSKNSSC